MDTLLTDLRFGVRSLRTSPGFTAVVLLTLALGIGANAAVFSVVNGVLVRPLPFKDPDRLVRLFQTYPNASRGLQPLSPADFVALRDSNRVFEAVGTYRVQDPLTNAFALVEDGRTELVHATWVTADFFKVLGVAPLLGRTFEPADEKPSSPLQVVISYDFWQRRLQGNPTVIGRPLHLVGMDVPVLGVMPAGFWFPRSDRADLWAIDRMGPPTRQGPWWFHTVARLRPGVSTAQAQNDLNAVAASVRRAFPLGSFGWTLVMSPLKRELVGDMGQALLLLMAAVGLVLVIACVNVTNLILARATERERDVAIRIALGASRSRIVGQLLTETLLLATAGAVLGLALARWGVAAIVALTPDNLQILHDANVSTDWRVVALTAAIAVACALVFGLAPACVGSLWQTTRVISESGRRATETPARRRLRGALVVLETSLSMLLLVGAGLVTRSLMKLQSVDAGVRSDRVLTAMITAQPGRLRTQVSIEAFFDRLLSVVRALPAVEAAAIGDGLPPATLADATNFIVEGQPVPDGQAQPIGDFLNVNGDYFRTLGIPVHRGRNFDNRDTHSATNTVIINETLAHRFFPNEDPIGRQLRIAGNWVAVIVGVVGNVKYQGLDVGEELTLYGAFTGAPRTMHLVVRTVGEPLELVPALRGALASVDPDVPLGRTRTLDRLISESIVRPRFRTTLLELFAMLALAIAAVGIYSVMSYSVSQRTHEMGIRLALGARAADVGRLVIGDGVRLACAGIGVGLIAAVAMTRAMSGLLFGVTPTDLLTYAAVALLLFVVALAACWIPARRATRADPVIALRAQ